jgi:hypothetical protein
VPTFDQPEQANCGETLVENAAGMEASGKNAAHPASAEMWADH